MKTIIIPQIDGTRIIAVSEADAAKVRAYPAMIDAVRPLGVVDIDRVGRLTWGSTGPLAAKIDPVVRSALRAASH